MVKRREQPVLFLCTGNYHRSQFAEVLFNSVAEKMRLPWRASSKGLALERGIDNVGPMAVEGVSVLMALDACSGPPTARPLVQRQFVRQNTSWRRVISARGPAC